uniref:NADH dehydrogenase subunit 3 n=1 Tax=Aonchotheca putorii TaxID=1647945 RepID=UPI00237B2B09|nr:NADH dehydrogenase subunit 3 [Aonchotheca putorii]WBV76987.1 NADH dehydrogenase subunit 3 [Aonchotheca putorii]
MLQIMMQFTFLFLSFMVVLMMLLVRQFSLIGFMKEKYSFECGFESFKLNRLPFSLNFFMISLIFVLFDLEIVILVAMMSYVSSFYLNLYIMSQLFLVFMLLSLLIEWNLGKLKWMY